MVILGCGEKPSFKTTVPVFPASGKILNQGKPLTGVILLFHSMDVNQKIKSQATTDDDGKFVTTTFKTADGAPKAIILLHLLSQAMSLIPLGKMLQLRDNFGKKGRSDFLLNMKIPPLAH
jgi:hypothetical protein